MGIDRLSVVERLSLMDEIWHSMIEADDGTIPDWHKEILDQRLDDADPNPGAGSSWEEVEARFR